MTTIELDRTDATATALYANPLDVAGTDTSTATTAEEVLQQAGLSGWGVHLRPMQTASESLTETGVTVYGESLDVPDAFAVVRTNPLTGNPQIVGTVGNKYHPVQNEELADFLNALVDTSGGQLTRAGDFYGKGKQFFLSLELPTDVLIGGRDLVQHNITIFSSHDGSVAITPAITNTRVVCQNQRVQVLNNAIASTKIRHTASYSDRLAVVQNILGIGWKEARSFDAKAETMLAAKIEERTFWEIVAQIFPPADADSKRGQTMQTNRLTSIASRLHGPESANTLTARKELTAWTAYNAITSHLQHSHANGSTNAHRTLLSASVQRSAALAEKLFHQYALTA